MLHAAGRGGAGGRGSNGRGVAGGRGVAAGRGGSANSGAGSSSGVNHNGASNAPSSNGGGGSGPLIPVGDPAGELMARLGALGPNDLSMNGKAVDESIYEMDSDDDEQGMLDGIQEFEHRLASGATAGPTTRSRLKKPAMPSSSGADASSSGKLSAPGGGGKTPAGGGEAPAGGGKALQQRRQPQQPQTKQTQQQQMHAMQQALHAVKQQPTAKAPGTKLPPSKVAAVDTEETADRDDVRAAMRDLDRFDFGRDSDDD